jgi:hypothetical protein
VLWGCFLDLVNALAGIGTAVALFPVVRRQNEAAALSFVASRMLEAAIIVVGLVSLLAVAILRQNLAGAPGTDTAALVATGRALVAVRDWTFLLRPGLMPGINDLLPGYLMYRSGLAPRLIRVMGLIGAPLLIASAIAAFFRGDHQVTALAAIATVPIFLRELSLGLWLVIKASSVPHHRRHGRPGRKGVAACKTTPHDWHGHKEPESSTPERVPANGFANQAEPDEADDMRHRRRSPKPSLVSETRRNVSDGGDALRGAHNLAATGSVPGAVPCACYDKGNRKSETADGALRGPCSLAAHALAAPIARKIALMALIALGLYADPVPRPVPRLRPLPHAVLFTVRGKARQPRMTLRHEQPAAG